MRIIIFLLIVVFIGLGLLLILVLLFDVVHLLAKCFNGILDLFHLLELFLFPGLNFCLRGSCRNICLNYWNFRFLFWSGCRSLGWFLSSGYWCGSSGSWSLLWRGNFSLIIHDINFDRLRAGHDLDMDICGTRLGGNYFWLWGRWGDWGGSDWFGLDLGWFFLLFLFWRGWSWNWSFDSIDFIGKLRCWMGWLSLALLDLSFLSLEGLLVFLGDI